MKILSQYSRLSFLRAALVCLVVFAAVLAGCSDRTGPRAVDDIRLRPDSAHLEPGETSVHRIVVLDEHDREMAAEWLPRIEWTLHAPDLADLEVDGDEVRVAAKAPGTVNLSAELASVERMFTVWVRPPGLARIEVEPDPVVVSTSGRLWVTTRLYHVDGHEMDPRDFRLSWSVVDTTLATVPIHSQRSTAGLVGVAGNSGEYETGKTGETTLVARVSGEVALVDLLVTLEPTPFAEAPRAEVESPSAVAVTWPTMFEARDGYEVERAGAADGP